MDDFLIEYSAKEKGFMMKKKEINEFIDFIENSNDSIYTNLMYYKNDKSHEYDEIGDDFTSLNVISDYGIKKIIDNLKFMGIVITPDNIDEVKQQLTNSLLTYEQMQELRDSNPDKFHKERYRKRNINEILKALDNKKAKDIIRIHNLICEKIPTLSDKDNDIKVSKLKYCAEYPKVNISCSMNGFIYIGIFGNQKRDLDDIEIKIYANIEKNKTAEVMSDLCKFMLDNDIRAWYKTRGCQATDMLTIRIDQSDKLETLIEYLKSNKNIILDNHPLMPNVNGVAITYDKGGSYNKYISDTMWRFFTQKQNDNGIQNFEEYVFSKEHLKDNKTIEAKMFQANLVSSFKDNISLEEFVKHYNDLRKCNDLEKQLNEIIKQLKGKITKPSDYLYSDEKLIGFIKNSLDEIKKENNVEYIDNDKIISKMCGKKLALDIDSLDNIFSDECIGFYNIAGDIYYLNKIFNKIYIENGYNGIKESINEFGILQDKFDKLYRENSFDKEKTLEEFYGLYSEEFKYINEFMYINKYIKRFSKYSLNTLIKDLQGRKFDVNIDSKDNYAYRLSKLYKKTI